MNRIYSNPLAAAALVLVGILAAGCGLVKEDRTDCPCWLTLLMQDAFRPARVATVHLEASAADSFEENITRGDSGDERGYTVSRRLVRVCVWSQLRSEAVDGTSLSFTSGEPIDTVWAYSNLVDCRYESAVDTVRMHRHFARVTVLPEDGTWTGMDVGHLAVSASVGGFDLSSLLPTPGGWSLSQTVPSSGAPGVTFIVPRMSYDDSFTLTVHGPDGAETDVWDLQSVLSLADYSWTKADLDDVTIRLSRTHGEAFAQIEPWKAGSVYEWTSDEF